MTRSRVPELTFAIATEDEVMQVFNKIINDVTTKLDAKLRDK